MGILTKAIVFIAIFSLSGCVATTTSSLSSIKKDAPTWKWNEHFTEYTPKYVAWVRLIDLAKMIGLDLSSPAFSTMENPAKTFRACDEISFHYLMHFKDISGFEFCRLEEYGKGGITTRFTWIRDTFGLNSAYQLFAGDVNMTLKKRGLIEDIPSNRMEIKKIAEEDGIHYLKLATREKGKYSGYLAFFFFDTRIAKEVNVRPAVTVAIEGEDDSALEAVKKRVKLLKSKIAES